MRDFPPADKAAGKNKRAVTTMSLISKTGPLRGPFSFVLLRFSFVSRFRLKTPVSALGVVATVLGFCSFRARRFPAGFEYLC
ncbi:MAG: hypothetical protein CR993_02380 [Rhodobacterales bacterium]|nr:MAG: hypothetical protein CR993_02380 [Rhodobacterales bacterium]